MNKEIPLEQLLKEHKISQRTYDKVKVAKQYIEHRYNLKTAKNLEWNEIINRINSLKICEKEKQKIKKEIYRQEMIKSRKNREKQSIHDYESIAIIGRGAFGEVHVCREKKTDKIYAIKKIKKDVLILKNQIIHILNEQIFMSRVNSPWIVELKASFQEDDYLYLVMEYLPGGDLMNLLIKRDILPEKEAKFYISELILAIESIHKLDCIHRDIKPDNILIDKNGHIKLSDFGLAKISDKLYEKEIEKYKTNINNKNNNKKDDKMTHNKNFSCVGTAYYVAPEVLNKKGYDKNIDWWSVGIIFYEMLVGYAPFCSEETSEVCYKVLNWKKFLKIPSKIKISEEAKDLIFKMINTSNNRLGKNGADEIKRHPFFNGIDWDNIRNSKPPFIPILKNEYDTSYFENFEIKEPFYPVTKNKFKRKDIEYLGYTFKEGFFDNNDLNEEYEKAIKTIDNEIKKEEKNNSLNNNFVCNNDKIFDKEKENIDSNIKINSYTTYNNIYTINQNQIKRKDKLLKEILNKDIKVPFRKVSISKKLNKIPAPINLKLMKPLNISSNNKYKELNSKNTQYTLSNTSSSINKNKLNVIHLPHRKTKPQIHFSNKNIVNTTNTNTINSIYDTYISNSNTNSINNYTCRSVKSNNNKPNNISYVLNNNNNNYKRTLNDISSNISKSKRNFNKLNIAPICKKIKNRLSPQSRGNVFIKKYFKNNIILKDKVSSTNNTYRNRILDNYIIKPIINKSSSSKCIKTPINKNCSCRNINNNKLTAIYTPINANHKNYNYFIDNKNLSQPKNRFTYIYKKKK